MIPDDQLRLLTAAVDGELTPAEARRLRQVLAASAEARDVFAQLQADQLRLRNLPVATPPADLRDRIMARLPRPALVPVPVIRPAAPTTPCREARIRPWALVVAVAASLLLGITTGSVWHSRTSRPADGVAHAPAGPRPPARDAGITPAESLSPAGGQHPSAPPTVDPPREVAPPGSMATTPPAEPELAPLPRPVHRDLFAFPPLPDVPPLDLVRVRVPFLTAVADFGREDVQKEFTDELGREPAFRIDLFAKDPARGTELFQAAARAVGVGVSADALTLERLKRKQATAYLVYTESLTPTELRDLLVRLAAVDARSPQRVFDMAHAVPAGPADLRDLKEVLGTDPGLWKRATPPHPDAAEPKPISAGTGDQVTRTLTGPSAKPAVLMTFAPTPARTAPAMSRELKQYLDRRGDRKPAALPVLIVIRQGSAG